MTVIAFYSPVMGSGKSAAAQHLVEKHGFKLVKFAAPLKDMTRALLPHLGVADTHVERHVEGDLKETPLHDHGTLTTRRIMQTLGTEWGRQTIANDFWTSIVYEQVAAHLQYGNKVVIDDLRFLNEWSTIQKLGGRCYRIWRPGVVTNSNHGSEGALEGIDLPTIVNDSTLKNFLLVVDRLTRA